MIDEWAKHAWLHNHKKFRFKTPMGEEYIDRVAHRPHDKVIEDLTPVYVPPIKSAKQKAEEDTYLGID